LVLGDLEKGAGSREREEKMTNQAAVQSSENEEPADENKPADRGNRERGKRRNRSGQGGPAPLDLDELRQLVELIDSHGFTDFEIERDGLHIRLRRELTPQIIQGGQAPPVHPAAGDSMLSVPPTGGPSETRTAVAAPVAKVEGAEAAEVHHIITSPIVGTFYRSPSPESGPFVNIGSQVSADTTVCIIEAMKLMNEIQAEVAGEIVEILVENGQPVEFGQPLFGVKR
jgi:acetyl-CoA carboxylase biotin carboxyl carrier protein